MTRIIDEYIVHCSATRPNWFAGKTILEKRNEIELWHVRDRKWKGIAYAGLFDYDGSFAGGRDLNDDGNFFDDVGAHTQGRNSRSVGGCLIGGFGSSEKDRFEDHFTPEQDRALRLHIEEVEDYAKRKLIVSGHNQYANKACPGFYVPDWYNRKYQKPLIGFQDRNLFRPDFEAPVAAPVAPAAPKKTQQAVPVLRLGSKGELVRTLQTRLKDLRYFPGAIDGDFGSKTDAAVVAFQTDNGLVRDGRVGPQTRAALEAAVPRALRNVNVETVASESRTIQEAEKGKVQVSTAGAVAIGTTALAQVEEVMAVVQQAEGAIEMIGGLAPSVLIVLAIAAAVYFAVHRFNGVRALRIEDAQTGANDRI